MSRQDDPFAGLERRPPPTRTGNSTAEDDEETTDDPVIPATTPRATRSTTRTRRRDRIPEAAVDPLRNSIRERQNLYKVGSDEWNRQQSLLDKLDAGNYQYEDNNPQGFLGRAVGDFAKDVGGVFQLGAEVGKTVLVPGGSWQEGEDGEFEYAPKREGDFWERSFSGVDIASGVGSAAGLVPGVDMAFEAAGQGSIEDVLDGVLPEFVGSDPFTADDFIPFDSEAGNLFDLPSLNQSVGFVTSLPGRAGLPIGSIDNVPLGLGLDDYRLGINPVKVLKYAFDEATNPVNYVTGPGVRQVLAAGAATTGARRGTQQWVRRVTADGAEEFVLEGTGRTGGSLARARASRQETAQTWSSNYNNLPAPLKAEMPDTAAEAGAKAIFEGGRTALLRDARRGVGGLTLKHLHYMGVDDGFTFGSAVFGGRGASLLGLLRTGRLKPAAGEDLGVVQGTVSAMGRFGDMLRGGAGAQGIRERLRSGQLTYMDAISEQALWDASGIKVPHYMSRATNRMHSILDESTLFRGKTEKEIMDGLDPEFVQSITNAPKGRFETLFKRDKSDAVTDPTASPLSEGAVAAAADANALKAAVIEAGQAAEESKFVMREALDSFLKYFEDPARKPEERFTRGMSNKALAGFVDDESIPLTHRLSVGFIVEGLKALESTHILRDNGLGLVPGAGSWTPRQLLDGAPTLFDDSTTARDYLNNVAAYEAYQDFVETGQSVLADTIYRASRQPDQILKDFGVDLTAWKDPQIAVPLGPVGPINTSTAEQSLTNVLQSLSANFTKDGNEIPWQWQAAVMEPFMPASRRALNEGNVEAQVAELWNVTDLMTLHQIGFQEFVQNARGGWRDIIGEQTRDEVDLDLFVGRSSGVGGDDLSFYKREVGAVGDDLSPSGLLATDRPNPRLTNAFLAEDGILGRTEENLKFVEDARTLLDSNPRKFDDKIGDIIRNNWYNPKWRTLYSRSEIVQGTRTGVIDWSKWDDPWNLFSREDQAVLAVAFERDAVEMSLGTFKGSRVEEELGRFQEWIDEWTETAQANFAMYENADIPDVARKFSQNVEAWYQHAALRLRLFGADAVDGIADPAAPRQSLISQPSPGRKAPTELGEAIGEAMEADNFFGMSEEASKFMARQVSTLYYQRTGEILEFGGEWVLREDGETQARVAQAILDAAGSLNELGRAHIGPLQPVLDFMARMRRTQQGQMTYHPGFHITNLKGALLNNHFKGKISPRGVGSYDEFGDAMLWALATMKDELADNALPTGGSPLWDLAKFAELGPEEARAAARLKKLDIEDEVRLLASSGHITATGRSGSIFDQVTELSEASYGRFSRPVARAFDTMSSVSEQAIAPVAPFFTQGRLPRRSPGRFSRENLRSAARQTTEGYVRGSLWWSAIRRDGLSVKAANRRVADTHMNYWDQSPGQQLMDELQPFWVFRSRMTMLLIDMISSTPGMLNQMIALEEYNGVIDPLGVGAPGNPYTIGAFGQLGGIDLYGSVRDPRSDALQGPEALYQFITGGLDVTSQEELLLDQFTDNLAPGIRFPIESMLNAVIGRDGAYEPIPRAVALEDGMIPRLAEVFGWGDEKINYVLELIGVDSPIYPLTSALQMTSDVMVVEHEGERVLFITSRGESMLTNMIPVLGTADRLATTQLRGRYIAEESPFTEEQLNQEANRRTLNAFSSWMGLSLVGSSYVQRMRQAEKIIRENQVEIDLVADAEEVIDQIEYLELLESDSGG